MGWIGNWKAFANVGSTEAFGLGLIYTTSPSPLVETGLEDNFTAFITL